MFGPGPMSIGFTPDEIKSGAKVTVLAQNPSTYEEQGIKIVGYEYAGNKKLPLIESYPNGPAPLLGPTGYELERKYLPLAGLTRADVNLCNVLKCRQIIKGRRVNDLPKGKVLEAAVKHCTSAHLRLPNVPVIAMGALAWKFMGGTGTVSDWRGFVHESS